MPVRRNKNTGEPIEEPSRKVDFGKKLHEHAGKDEELTVVPPPRVTGVGKAERDSVSSGDVFSPFEAPTVLIDSERKQKDSPDETRLFRQPSNTAEGTDEDSMADPVVGWLVVVDGPGKGQVCHLGYGANSLGRGDNSRVRLDFGDDLISREGHATVTYDTRGRKFYLQHGGGKNLTYLNDEPVLVPTVLEAMMNFSIGQTTLRFIPFCGPEFDWEDVGVG